MSTYHSSSDEEQVQQSGYTFKPSQQSFLREKLDGYVGAEKKKRSKYVKKVANHLQKEIEESSGNEMTQDEFRPQKKLKEVWDCRWNSRLVFMRLNAAKIKALAHRMVGGEVDVDQFLDDWDRGEVDDFDGEHGKGRNPKTKGKKGGEDDWFFNHYQAAASLLINGLSEKEKAHYAAVAEKWKKQGPPEEQQSKLADKAATKKAYSFAKFVDKQLNGVAVMLLGWRGEDGKPTAVKVEFTEELGRGPNFIDVHQKKIEALFRDFKAHVWKLYNDDSDAEEDDWVKTKNIKKPIMVMKTNDYGEPFLPNPNTRKVGEQRGDWYGHALRSFFIYHYGECFTPSTEQCLIKRNVACSSNISPDHVRFPWSKLEENKRAFIKPGFMPDNYLDLLKEPSDMKVSARVQVFDYLYERQREAREVPSKANQQTFEISAYVDRWGELQTRAPRKKKANETDPNNSDLELELFINRMQKEDSTAGRREGERTMQGPRKGKSGVRHDRSQDSDPGTKKPAQSRPINEGQPSTAKTPFQLRFARWNDHESVNGGDGDRNDGHNGGVPGDGWLRSDDDDDDDDEFGGEGDRDEPEDGGMGSDDPDQDRDDDFGGEGDRDEPEDGGMGSDDPEQDRDDDFGGEGDRDEPEDGGMGSDDPDQDHDDDLGGDGDHDEEDDSDTGGGRDIDQLEDDYQGRRTRSRSRARDLLEEGASEGDEDQPSSFKGVRTRRQRREGMDPKSISAEEGLRTTRNRRAAANPDNSKPVGKRKADQPVASGSPSKRRRLEPSAQSRSSSPKKPAPTNKKAAPLPRTPQRKAAVNGRKDGALPKKRVPGRR
ncbi:hypothetical protein CC1G_04138 [Coprinopsis cinerea okayama7|uniref:Uncharacterized protein n=1 Tax=Coprinopsis cinerea (strain Okayama-7 / 130 / ATCC MYA-4618 / FGSC 9003) TaxID=240176 RepID=A8NW45_COPC7|nr:hypothetical protein CC1G_04138 [Coprinopsis cinerea okayama7\|eukprot:XP_001836825.2 hypothetical protein CC1G_04138 [Coprinopsis cinerea okayama7\